jgi:uncharacterized membrane protein (UPF0127 family)
MGKIRMKFLLVIAALALMVPAFCAMAVDVFETHLPDNLAKTITIVNKKGEKHSFDVAWALTQEQQSQGLMFVKDMPLGNGMMFLFRTVQERTFWMKDTLIPLDMLFIEPDGRIQHVHSMAKPQDYARITSGKPCQAVLEINGGPCRSSGDRGWRCDLS